MQERFLESDKNLLTVKRLLNIVVIVLRLIGLVGAVICIYQATYWPRHMTGMWIWLAIVSVAGFWFVGFIVRVLGMFALWKAYDVKMIRNALYNVAESEPLKEMGNQAESAGNAWASAMNTTPAAPPANQAGAQRNCAKCGAPLNGPYCMQCGQMHGQ